VSDASAVNDTRVAGIVLAAGASRRLGQPKQLLSDESGRAMVVRTTMQLRDAGCAPVIVVTGAAHEDVARALEVHDVTVVYNGDWSEGMGSSIRCAMVWLDTQAVAANMDAVIIAACDMPGVSSTHLRELISAFRNEGSRVASGYDASSGARVRGIPALFPKRDWSALRALAGDRGARELLLGTDTSIVALTSGGFDLDTPADVEQWRSER
jgi:molybdenum cofactor cytidylyltransferase